MDNVNFTQTTLQKEGTLQVDDVAYNISATAINGNLTRLYCGITKKVTVQQKGQAPVEQPISIGYIVLEHGRQVTEATQGEDITPHLAKFQEILAEVVGVPTT